MSLKLLMHFYLPRKIAAGKIAAGKLASVKQALSCKGHRSQSTEQVLLSMKKDGWQTSRIDKPLQWVDNCI